VFFETAFVFELSRTEPLPGVGTAPLEPPSEPLTGNSHDYLIAPLLAFARSLGYSVSFKKIPRSGGLVLRGGHQRARLPVLFSCPKTCPARRRYDPPPHNPTCAKTPQTGGTRRQWADS
jgi:hypothetical protein